MDLIFKKSLSIDHLMLDSSVNVIVEVRLTTDNALHITVLKQKPYIFRRLTFLTKWHISAMHSWNQLKKKCNFCQIKSLQKNTDAR